MWRVPRTLDLGGWIHIPSLTWDSCPNGIHTVWLDVSWLASIRWLRAWPVPVSILRADLISIWAMNSSMTPAEWKRRCFYLSPFHHGNAINCTFDFNVNQKDLNKFYSRKLFLLLELLAREKFLRRQTKRMDLYLLPGWCNVSHFFNSFSWWTAKLDHPSQA